MVDHYCSHPLVCVLRQLRGAWRYSCHIPPSLTQGIKTVEQTQNVEQAGVCRGVGTVLYQRVGKWRGAQGYSALNSERLPQMGTRAYYSYSIATVKPGCFG